MSFELTPVDANFALKELEQLNPSKSTGLDGIPPRFLRDGACIWKKPITYLVNLSITSGIVPDDMKIARVCPTITYLVNLSITSGSIYWC
jgi:hypothetical protein